jgi:hypothetical protein
VDITPACPKKPWRSRVLHCSLRAIGPHGPEASSPPAGILRGGAHSHRTPAPLHAAVYDVSRLPSTVAEFCQGSECSALSKRYGDFRRETPTGEHGAEAPALNERCS